MEVQLHIVPLAHLESGPRAADRLAVDDELADLGTADRTVHHDRRPCAASNRQRSDLAPPPEAHVEHRSTYPQPGQRGAGSQPIKIRREPHGGARRIRLDSPQAEDSTGQERRDTVGAHPACPDLAGIGYVDRVGPRRPERVAGRALPGTFGRVSRFADPRGEARRLTDARGPERTRLTPQCPRVLGQSGRKQRVGEPKRGVRVTHDFLVARHPRAEHRIRADFPPLECIRERSDLSRPHGDAASVELLRVLGSLTPKPGDATPVEELEAPREITFVHRGDRDEAGRPSGLPDDPSAVRERDTA